MGEDGAELMPGGSYAATTLPKAGVTSGQTTGKPRRKIKVPDIFREKTAFEVSIHRGWSGGGSYIVGYNFKTLDI